MVSRAGGGAWTLYLVQMRTAVLAATACAELERSVTDVALRGNGSLRMGWEQVGIMLILDDGRVRGRRVCGEVWDARRVSGSV